MSTLSAFLSNVSLEQPRSFGPLTLFPFEQAQTKGFSYRVLDEALADGSLRVSEISEAGQVPTILVRNFGDEPVLILDGEELAGAKQNRILNLTILVAAKSDLEVPVSCVEQGRWGYRTRKFSASKRALYADLRASKVAQVSKSLALRRSREAKQSEIWRDIASKSSRMGVAAPTGAMADIYDRLDNNLDEATRKLAPSEGETGAIIAINGRIRGMDCFDRPSTYKRLFPKLLGSYALDAFDPHPHGISRDLQTEPQKFITLLREKARVDCYPALGLGTDVRVAAPSVAAAALEVEGKIIHFCAFPLGE